MILENLKQYVLLVTKLKVILLVCTWKTMNVLYECIKKFKSKAKPQNGSNLKKVKEDVLNSAMELLKEEKLF